MSKLTPYEEELAKQLNDLPLPDENSAWGDMEKLLDKGNTKGGGKNRFFRPGNSKWGLLALAALTGIVWICIHKNNDRKTNNEPTTSAPGNAITTTPVPSNNNTISSVGTKNSSADNNKTKTTASDSASGKNTGSVVNSNNSGNSTSSNKTSSANNTGVNNNSGENGQKGSINNNESLNNNSSGDEHTTTANNSRNSNRTLVSAMNRKKHTSSLHNSNSITGNGDLKNTNETADKNEMPDSVNSANTINSSTSTSANNSFSKNDHRIRHNAYRNSPNNNSLNTAAVAGDEDNEQSHSRPKRKGHLIVNNGKNPGYHVKAVEQTDGEDEPVVADNSIDSTSASLYYYAKAEPLLYSFNDKDSIALNLVPLSKQDSIDLAKKNQDSKSKTNGFTIGIAEQQAVATTICNCAPSYSAAKSAAINDYIPSVYARLYHKNKWFIQGEAKYDAPQFVDPLIYKVMTQNLPFNYLTTNYVLERIQYDQLTLGLHYFVKPNWSVGAGITYNIFSAADIQLEIHKKMYGSASDSLAGYASLTDKDDPGFDSLMKSNFQLLLETQYKWKRFSLGASYSVGLTPYIKYTDPYSGNPAQKNNGSLNIFIRYELWKRKR